MLHHIAIIHIIHYTLYIIPPIQKVICTFLQCCITSRLYILFLFTTLHFSLSSRYTWYILLLFHFLPLNPFIALSKRLSSYNAATPAYITFTLHSSFHYITLHYIHFTFISPLHYITLHSSRHPKGYHPILLQHHLLHYFSLFQDASVHTFPISYIHYFYTPFP